jgi:hypothetical protein
VTLGALDTRERRVPPVRKIDVVIHTIYLSPGDLLSAIDIFDQAGLFGTVGDGLVRVTIPANLYVRYRRPGVRGRVAVTLITVDLFLYDVEIVVVLNGLFRLSAGGGPGTGQEQR